MYQCSMALPSDTCVTLLDTFIDIPIPELHSQVLCIGNAETLSRKYKLKLELNPKNNVTVDERISTQGTLNLSQDKNI